MTIIKTASEAYAEHRQQIYDEEYQKAMYELAHQGCDKCPCCGSKEFHKQRKITRKKYLSRNDYWYYDEYTCTECESVWKSDKYGRFSYDVVLRGIALLFAILCIIFFALARITNTDIWAAFFIIMLMFTVFTASFLDDRCSDIEFELKIKNNKEGVTNDYHS